MATMKIKQGDRVKVLTGKDKDAEGIVLSARPAEHRVVVEQVNVVKKAMRPTQANPEGGISSIEAPIDVSNVALICPSCKKPTRVGSRRDEAGKRIRVCKKCNADID